ncbi:Uncharacterised protein [Vibrio cholerae]|nr:Uncharacterised protein [Vibrio cholerae]
MFNQGQISIGFYNHILSPLYCCCSPVSLYLV